MTWAMASYPFLQALHGLVRGTCLSLSFFGIFKGQRFVVADIEICPCVLVEGGVEGCCFRLGHHLVAGLPES